MNKEKSNEPKIIHQKTFRYAEIKLVKNYSRIKTSVERDLTPSVRLHKMKLPLTTNTQKSKFFYCSEGHKKKEKGVVVASKDQKNDFFFLLEYNDEKEYLSTEEKEKFTTGDFELITRNFSVSADDTKINKHYINPFANIKIRQVQTTILLDGDKLKIKTVRFTKQRGFNQRYFTRRLTVDFFSFDLKFGNFYIGSKDKPFNGHKLTGTVNKNNFKSLLSAITERFEGAPDPFNIDGSSDYFDSDKLKELQKTFNDNNFLLRFSEELRERVDIDTRLYDFTNGFLGNYNLISDAFVKIKGIKVPDDYYKLLVEWYPTQKVLKKNKMKLVQSILAMLGCNNKFNVKLLHKYPMLSPMFISDVYEFFGDDANKYMQSINWELLNVNLPDEVKNNRMRNHRNPTYGGQSKIFAARTMNTYNTRVSVRLEGKAEKKHFVTLFNLLAMPKYYEKSSCLIEVTDHFKLYHNLKVIFPNLKMTGITKETFNAEHMEFTTLSYQIRKKMEKKITYNPEFLELVETPIIIGEEVYTPVVLVTETDYREEGKFMHHCVGGYHGKEYQIIVSLRNSEDKRVTTQYDMYQGRVVQSKSYCNARPPEEFKEPLNTLKMRVIGQKGVLPDTKTELIPIIVNGVNLAELEKKRVLISTENRGDVLLAELNDF